LVETNQLLLKMEIQIDIPQDIALDEKDSSQYNRNLEGYIERPVSRGPCIPNSRCHIPLLKMIFDPLRLWPIDAIVLSLLIVMLTLRKVS